MSQQNKRKSNNTQLRNGKKHKKGSGRKINKKIHFHIDMTPRSIVIPVAQVTIPVRNVKRRIPGIKMKKLWIIKWEAIRIIAIDSLVQR